LLLNPPALAFRAGDFGLVMLSHGHGERKPLLALLAPVIVDRHKRCPFDMIILHCQMDMAALPLLKLSGMKRGRSPMAASNQFKQKGLLSQ
jgi:hypothetical protein